MLSLNINDIRAFMSRLLADATFDRFHLVEAKISGGFHLDIDGRRLPDYYDTDDPRREEPFITWGEVRHLVFETIRGRRLPISMKIILALPDASVRSLTARASSSADESPVQGMYLNILYSRGELLLTSGISSSTFLIDRSLEQLFEESIRQMLKKLEIL